MSDSQNYLLHSGVWITAWGGFFCLFFGIILMGVGQQTLIFLPDSLVPPPHAVPLAHLWPFQAADWTQAGGPLCLVGQET